MGEEGEEDLYPDQIDEIDVKDEEIDFMEDEDSLDGGSPSLHGGGWGVVVWIRIRFRMCLQRGIHIQISNRNFKIGIEFASGNRIILRTGFLLKENKP